MRKRRSRDQGGFTLVEVMMATGLFSVAGMMILGTFVTATAFASKRQQDQRLAQVVVEARGEAQAHVDNFVPSRDKPLPGGEDGAIDPRPSTRFSGYSYGLTFVPVDKTVPEAGFEIEVTVTYGDGLEDKSTLFLNRSSIPDEEFATSITHEAELRGTDSENGGQEK